MVTHPFLEFFYPPPSTSWHLSLSLIVSKYISSICRKPCYDHLGSKKVKNISLNSSVANTERPIISKTHRLEESLNDANRSFENNKEWSNDISISSETPVAKP